MWRILAAIVIALLFEMPAGAEQYLVTVHAVELSWSMDRGDESDEVFQEKLEAFARQHEPTETLVNTIETLATLDAPFHARASEDHRTFEVGGSLQRTPKGHVRLEIRPRLGHWDLSTKIPKRDADGTVRMRPSRGSLLQMDTHAEWDATKLGFVSEADIWEDEPLKLDTSLARRSLGGDQGDSVDYQRRGEYLVIGGLVQKKYSAPPKKSGPISNDSPATVELTSTTFLVRLRRYLPELADQGYERRSPFSDRSPFADRQ